MLRKINNYDLSELKSWAKESEYIKAESPASEDIYFKQRNIRRQGNHIYFYDYVDEETQMIFTNLVKEATRDILIENINNLANNQIDDGIIIHINSPGGSAHCGFALYDFIKNSKIGTEGIIEGTCDSAATLIFLACTYRQMTPNSSFLMHQCSWGAYGQNKLMQDLALNAEKTMAKLRKIYFNETTFAEKNSKGEKLSDSDRILMIQNQLEHDIDWNYEECKKYGIIDMPVEQMELSKENQNKLEDFIEKLFQEQLKEKEKKEKEAEKNKKAEAKKPTKKTTKK